MFLNFMISDVSFVVEDFIKDYGIKIVLLVYKYVFVISSFVFFVMFYGGIVE